MRGKRGASAVELIHSAVGRGFTPAAAIPRSSCRGRCPHRPGGMESVQISSAAEVPQSPPPRGGWVEDPGGVVGAGGCGHPPLRMRDTSSATPSQGKATLSVTFGDSSPKGRAKVRRTCGAGGGTGNPSPTTPQSALPTAPLTSSAKGGCVEPMAVRCMAVRNAIGHAGG